jgi:hypothetical protein
LLSAKALMSERSTVTGLPVSLPIAFQGASGSKAALVLAGHESTEVA